MIKGIAHTAYNVLNMEKSLQFYCDVLGFKKAFEISNDEGKPWIVYLKIKDGLFIELFYTHNQVIKPRPLIGYAHLCLEVDDIQKISNHLKEKGIHLDVDPIQGKDLNWQCWAKDPDGNPIEFMQMDPQSPQSLS
ncbi:MAG: Glyoxalase/bleomycin resistance protein/dioxygenase [Haloplasmataceae bacterium]|jgi:lactoylglutathione lyase|nr:Glyoxalase/bleomycin resistance protein/dioxygenase [Haloplasmataceae bacterium]